MKKLTMIRHASSAWDQHDIDDIDRPLDKDGIRDAMTMGEVLMKRGFNPDVVIVSSALRAIRTAEAITSVIKYPETRIVLDDKLYLANPDEIFEAVKRSGWSENWLACVCHNPGISQFADRFLSNRIGNIPTCGIVELQFDTENWDLIEKSNMERSVFDHPKKYETDSKWRCFF